MVVTESHPVQYHAPVYRALASLNAGEFSVLYGSNFSITGYRDQEFGTAFSWDTDLMSGYPSTVVRKVSDGGAVDYESLTGDALSASLDRSAPGSLLALGYHHPFDRAAIRWAHRNKRPLLLRAETSDGAKSRSFLKAGLRDFLLRRLYRRTAAFCYVGQQSLRHYQRLGVPKDSLFFSPYCVDASIFELGDREREEQLRVMTRQELGISATALVLIFSGKLSHRKGVDLIPQALRLLPDTLQRRIHVIFLGDGSERSSLEAQFTQGTASFVGFKNQRELSAYYHAADALLLPSREGETWGLVVNEALLHGLPCLVSERVGSHLDLVKPGETGEVFRPNDVNLLADAMMRLLPRLPDPAISAACRGLVKHYSVQQAAQGIAEAWAKASESS
jgi:glycosyltransferase involved in cell wall biosynthesis